MELKNTITIVSWLYRQKYGYLGKYITNREIYRHGKLKYNKCCVLHIVEYKDRNVADEQFITISGNWFRRNEITPIE